MATTPVEDMLTEIATLGDLMKQITDKRAQVENYKAAKQNYADLLTAAQAELDTLTESSKPAIKRLGSKINNAIP